MPVKSTVLGPGQLTIGQAGDANQIANRCTKTSLEPKTDAGDEIYVLSGDVESDADTTTWSLKGSALDDFDTDNFFEWCLKNAGKTMPFVFTPNNTAKRSYSGSVKVRPIGLGGDVKKRNTNDFEFQLVGTPTPVDTATVSQTV